MLSFADEMLQSDQQKFAWTVVPSRLSHLVGRSRINLIKSTTTFTVLGILLRLMRTKFNEDQVFLSYVLVSLGEYHSPDLPHCSSPHILYTVHYTYISMSYPFASLKRIILSFPTSFTEYKLFCWPILQGSFSFIYSLKHQPKWLHKIHKFLFVYN